MHFLHVSLLYPHAPPSHMRGSRRRRRRGRPEVLGIEILAAGQYQTCASVVRRAWLSTRVSVYPELRVTGPIAGCSVRAARAVRSVPCAPPGPMLKVERLGPQGLIVLACGHSYRPGDGPGPPRSYPGRRVTAARPAGPAPARAPYRSVRTAQQPARKRPAAPPSARKQSNYVALITIKGVAYTYRGQHRTIALQ
jgi:hypothetical protein